MSNDKYNEEKFPYGYLTIKCASGEPVGMKGGYFNPHHIPCSSNKVGRRCKGCGCSSKPLLNTVPGLCPNCTSLDARGEIGFIDSDDCVSCIYCGIDDTNDKHCGQICKGCKIEPLTSVIKPAKQD